MFLNLTKIFPRLYQQLSAASDARPTGLLQIPTSSRAAQGHILVPVGCAAGLLQLERELRARQRIGTAGVTLGWRRLSPSAELFVDPESGARCAVRDTGALGAERYYWTVSAFGDHQVAAGRTGEVTEARSQAEAALVAYMRRTRVV